MSTTAESIVADAAQGGTLLAFQVGCRYPRFVGIPREPLAQLFDRHGFADVAKWVRSGTGDERRALSHVCGRPGDLASKGLHVVQVANTEGDHQIAWVICKASEVGAENVEHAPGARVFYCPAGIFSADPVNGAADPACRSLADSLAARARALAATCDVSTVSKACTAALREVGAYPFLSRGAYILRANDPDAQRLVALYRDLRAAFYDERSRSGLQAGVAEITGHAGSGNMLAVSDAVINDAEAQLLKLAEQLETDRRKGAKLRPGTLVKHRDTAQAVLDSLRPVRDLLGASFERIAKITEAVLDSYKAAASATDLSFPDWAASEVADIRAAAASDAAAEGGPVEPEVDAGPDPFDI